MNRLTLATAAALTLAAPAFASDQLALSLGVEPGAFTTAQLVELSNAMEQNDRSKIDFILSGADDGSTMSSMGGQISSGHAQLARGLGVDPADYSVAELKQLRDAMEENDRTRIDYIKSGAGDSAAMSSDGEPIAPGYVQLARQLGVDPGDFTNAQLAKLSSAVEQNEQAAIRFILDNAS